MHDEASGEELPVRGPPHRIYPPTNTQHWDDISFLHWPFEPRSVQRLLPNGLTVHRFEGSAWVGITPFRMKVRPSAARTVVSEFNEINVRTYVHGPDDSLGLHFLHMEVSRLWFLSLRALGLPYVHRRLSLERQGQEICYRSSERGRSANGSLDIVVTVGDPLEWPTGGPLEQFLTARWTAFHDVEPLLLATPVEHPPWSLCRATIQRCKVDRLFHSAGLPVPHQEPLAHYSPGVVAEVGWPRVVARTS